MTGAVLRFASSRSAATASREPFGGKHPRHRATGLRLAQSTACVGVRRSVSSSIRREAHERKATSGSWVWAVANDCFLMNPIVSRWTWLTIAFA